MNEYQLQTSRQTDLQTRSYENTFFSCTGWSVLGVSLISGKAQGAVSQRGTKSESW